MDLAGTQRLVPALPPAPEFSFITHNLKQNRAALIFGYDRLFRAKHADWLIHLGLASDTALQHWHPRANRSSSILDHVA